MSRIDHVHVRSSNPAATIEFFTTFFGARVIKEFESLGRKLTIMSLEGESNLSVIHLPPATANPKPEASAIDHIGIAVTNIQELVRRLKEKGYKFPVEPGRSPSGATVAFCLGPDNIYLELMEKA